MDLLQLGIDLGVVAGIIGLTQAAKSFDKGKKLERFYVLVPVLLGLIAGVALTSPLTVAGVARAGIAYGGVAALAYMARKRLTAAGVPLEPEQTTAGPDGPMAGQ